jgi:outer membrane receptor protein involved in Fe transport
LKAYFVNDVRLRYNFSTKAIKNIGLGLLVNNMFSKKYEANGATYPEVMAVHWLTITTISRRQRAISWHRLI